ncbi:SPT3 Dosage dependent suppressor of Ty-induced promoter mutations-like protein [Vanrija albida]|uniref:SPT3 Dosage dependent suppressor of Ty-induced promoter mutations-like protein n=1 Tax=Vanrija albida TaxID=181172 RepID=A0ABR3QAV2_9TREE
MDSSSTSSPFSTRSTIPSSPENAGGDTAPAKSSVLAAFPASSGHLMQGMQAIINNLTGAAPFSQLASSDFFSTTATNNEAKPKLDVKPASSLFGQTQAQASARPSTSAAPSVTGSGQGGSRTEPPKRMYEVDGLPLVSPPLEEIASAFPNSNNTMLLQGDPQHIHKQRVETAIRVIIDILRMVPRTPSTPAMPPSIQTLLPQDATGNVLAVFERLATFRGLRLQAGTTTKTSSKKQLQAGAIPAHQVAYVETAVYTSSDNPKRVYACKRCRNREERRRQNKDAARKKQVASDSDTSASPVPRPSLQPPSEDYITGENAHQYDPHRVSQVVEEPPWDPTVPDWRHEIVLFNSPPEVAVKEGSCFWLPFRVICYCKCHGEKQGFHIKFTLRTLEGHIIASAMTHPIKITDDHKTDAKSKPRGGVERMTSATPSAQAAPRVRKGRMSTASSQRQSPTPSESEMSVTSEVGAVVQKQTPQVRQGKPYERPPSQSPAVQPTSLPFDFLQEQNPRPRLSRQQSTSSYTSQADITNWTPDALAQTTVSPDALRRPNFASMTALANNGLGGSLSNQPSVAPSPAQQFGGLGQNGLGGSNGNGNGLNGNGLQNGLVNGGGMHHQNNLSGSFSSDMFTNGPMSLSPPGGLDLSALNLFSNGNNVNRSGSVNQNGSQDVDMTNDVASQLENMLFGTSTSSQAASVASSFRDDASQFSAFQAGSLFSDSGLPPDNTLDDMIDYSGGESNAAISPMQHLNLSPSVPMGGIDLGMNQSPFGHTNGLPQVSPNADADAHTRALLALLAQHQTQPRPPPQPVPVVSHVIPGEGDMAGGAPIAIAGRLFTPETVIVFGGRPAVTSFVSDSFLQCTLPPAPSPGDVEVTVQGYMKDPTVPTMMFKYTGTDKEMMRLMLQVRQLHQSSDPAMRLVDHITRSQNNSDFSDRSSMSPAGIQSPFDAEAPPRGSTTFAAAPAAKDSEADDNDLQTTLIDVINAMDEDAPGSLRRSGAVNEVNKSQQTLLHLASVMGFHRLLRRLISVGAHLNVQDVNGFTPLAHAALCSQTICARILLEAGASYDLPTVFGEMPLDLAKSDEHSEVEALLLSAVWSTKVDTVNDAGSSVSLETGSEIDDDNPSSDSDHDSVSRTSRILRRRPSRRSRGKQRVSPPGMSQSTSPKRDRRASLVATPPLPGSLSPVPRDDPPPYAPPDSAGWMSRTLSNISHPIQDTVWQSLPKGLPTLWSAGGEKNGSGSQGWVAFPAPSWDTLQKMTSPEEVKLFTQAMAAAALNAVVQSGATAGPMDGSPRASGKRQPRRRHSNAGSSPSSRSRELGQVAKPKQVKHDRMLYLFWLPVLLFVGFWLLVTAVPIATGFCLLYARQISRAIKQRL